MRKEITKLKALNIELKSINSNHLKSILLTCLKSETFKNISLNHFKVMKIFKNLKYMFFSISVNINNINKLYIIIKKYNNILSILNNQIKIFNSVI